MTKFSYAGYCCPAEIIQQVIRLYLRFTLSFRDVEDMLAERGIILSYETARRWFNRYVSKTRSERIGDEDIGKALLEPRMLPT